MAGGAPAGIIKFPGDDLCSATSTIIDIMIISGKSKTTPSGTDIFELPFSRTRRLKKDNPGAILSFSFVRSWSDVRLGAEGIRLMKLRTNPIIAKLFLIARLRSVSVSPRKKHLEYIMRRWVQGSLRESFDQED